MAGFVERYGDALAAAVIRTCPPFYDADARQSCGFDLRRLLRRPMGAQADVIRAVALSLQQQRSTTIVGEMGTGKTAGRGAASALA